MVISCSLGLYCIVTMFVRFHSRNILSTEIRNTYVFKLPVYTVVLRVFSLGKGILNRVLISSDLVVF